MDFYLLYCGIRSYVHEYAPLFFILKVFNLFEI